MSDQDHLESPATNIDLSDPEAALWAWSSVQELLTFVITSSGAPTHPEPALSAPPSSSTSLFDQLIPDPAANIESELSAPDLEWLAGGCFGQIGRGSGRVERPVALL
jgi:hypothetical protein